MDEGESNDYVDVRDRGTKADEFFRVSQGTPYHVLYRVHFGQYIQNQCPISRSEAVERVYI